MSTSGSSPEQAVTGCPPRRRGGSSAGPVLLFLTLAAMALGVLGLVAFWLQRLVRAR